MSGRTRKRALITGITGQDGAYLAGALLEKGYEVHGIYRRSSVDNTVRLKELKDVRLHYGDLIDGGALFRIVQQVTPDEIYNLAAQSDVAVSFANPEYSAHVNGLGTLRLLETIRLLGLTQKTRFYQASTSELFGLVQERPQTEKTPFYPRSPYAVSKLYAYWITINYRESYGLFACNGILFNHESPLRAESFVTRKISRGLTRIVWGLQDTLFLGNLEAKRDWGHTRDFMEMAWVLLQQEKPDDFVIATGKQHSVRDFVNRAAEELGLLLEWQGEGLEEKGLVRALQTGPSCKKAEDLVGKAIIQIDPKLLRPAEVESLLADASKAASKLGWKPKTSFQALVSEMVHADYRLAEKEAGMN